MCFNFKCIDAVGVVCAECLDVLGLSNQDVQIRKDQDLAHQISAWEQVAHEGGPTSAHAPMLSSPPPSLRHALIPDLPTPPCPPNPMKKHQLTAAKRLEKELKEKSKKDQKKIETQPECDPASKEESTNKEDDLPDHVPEIRPKEKKNSKKADGKKKTTKKETNQKRKPNNGPVWEAMQSYIQAMRADGVSYQGALRMWKSSAARAAIVNKMSASEQKRRRY